MAERGGDQVERDDFFSLISLSISITIHRSTCDICMRVSLNWLPFSMKEYLRNILSNYFLEIVS